MGRLKQELKLLYFRLRRRSYKKNLLGPQANYAEFRLLESFLKQRPLFFIDVGANKGQFLYLAERILPSSQIWAFEPLPWFARKLRSLFPGVRVFNLALSDKKSKATIYVPAPNGVPDDSLASLAKPAAGSFDTYEVSVTTLDEVVEQNHLGKSCFLKIDVEGHEFAVLQGGAHFIRTQVQLMLVEIEERHHAGKKLSEMISSVEEMGFVAFYLHPAKKQLVKFGDYPQVAQEKKHLNTPLYINNFWFFAKQSPYEGVVANLNQTTF